MVYYELVSGWLLLNSPCAKLDLGVRMAHFFFGSETGEHGSGAMTVLLRLLKVGVPHHIPHRLSSPNGHAQAQ